MTKITINMSDNTIEIHSDQVLASDDNPLTEIDPPRVGARSLPMDWNVAARVRELKFKMWDAACVECKGNRTKMSGIVPGAAAEEETPTIEDVEVATEPIKRDKLPQKV